MDKIRVLVADDHPAFREGLCRLLSDEKDMEVVARSGDSEETVALGSRLCPDVAIIDVAMPKANGIEAARQIKEVCPATAVLMLSAYDYESYTIASLRAGAAGYMMKDAPMRELINAIRMIHSGETVFDLRATKAILSRLMTDSNQERGRVDTLHDRELQVLKLAARGVSNKEIGKQLTISERTVQTHLVNIFRKLRVASRTEAVLRAFKKGWLTLDDLP